MTASATNNSSNVNAPRGRAPERSRQLSDLAPLVLDAEGASARIVHGAHVLSSAAAAVDDPFSRQGIGERRQQTEQALEHLIGIAAVWRNEADASDKDATSPLARISHPWP